MKEHTVRPSRRFVDLMLTFYLCLPPSPLMSRVFPDSFPNKQYQLLFTQGAGEAKEGERSRPTCGEVVGSNPDEAGYLLTYA